MSLFKPGQLVATPGSLAFFEKQSIDPLTLVKRHIGGDWGNLGASDIKTNTDALAYDGRILSCYEIATKQIYIITEWDRSVTTILLSHEY